MLLTKGNKYEYLKIARKIAEMAGYDSNKLKLANDNIHKLRIDNIYFGNINYPDFILFYIDNQISEAIKHRKNYLKRSSKIKGDWKSDFMSKNNLARKIIWAEDLD